LFVIIFLCFHAALTSQFAFTSSAVPPSSWRESTSKVPSSSLKIHTSNLNTPNNHSVPSLHSAPVENQRNDHSLLQPTSPAFFASSDNQKSYIPPSGNPDIPIIHEPLSASIAEGPLDTFFEKRERILHQLYEQSVALAVTREPVERTEMESFSAAIENVDDDDYESPKTERVSGASQDLVGEDAKYVQDLEVTSTIELAEKDLEKLGVEQQKTDSDGIDDHLSNASDVEQINYPILPDDLTDTSARVDGPVQLHMDQTIDGSISTFVDEEKQSSVLSKLIETPEMPNAASISVISERTGVEHPQSQKDNASTSSENEKVAITKTVTESEQSKTLFSSDDHESPRKRSQSRVREIAAMIEKRAFAVDDFLDARFTEISSNVNIEEGKQQRAVTPVKEIVDKFEKGDVHNPVVESIVESQSDTIQRKAELPVRTQSLEELVEEEAAKIDALLASESLPSNETPVTQNDVVRVESETLTFDSDNIDIKTNGDRGDLAVEAFVMVEADSRSEQYSSMVPNTQSSKTKETESQFTASLPAEETSRSRSRSKEASKSRSSSKVAGGRARKRSATIDIAEEVARVELPDTVSVQVNISSSNQPIGNAETSRFVVEPDLMPMRPSNHAIATPSEKHGMQFEIPENIQQSESKRSSDDCQTALYSDIIGVTPACEKSNENNVNNDTRPSGDRSILDLKSQPNTTEATAADIPPSQQQTEIPTEIIITEILSSSALPPPSSVSHNKMRGKKPPPPPKPASLSASNMKKAAVSKQDQSMPLNTISASQQDNAEVHPPSLATSSSDASTPANAQLAAEEEAAVHETDMSTKTVDMAEICVKAVQSNKSVEENDDEILKQLVTTNVPLITEETTPWGAKKSRPKLTRAYASADQIINYMLNNENKSIEKPSARFFEKSAVGKAIEPTILPAATVKAMNGNQSVSIEVAVQTSDELLASTKKDADFSAEVPEIETPSWLIELDVKETLDQELAKCGLDGTDFCQTEVADKPVPVVDTFSLAAVESDAKPQESAKMIPMIADHSVVTSTPRSAYNSEGKQEPASVSRKSMLRTPSQTNLPTPRSRSGSADQSATVRKEPESSATLSTLNVTTTLVGAAPSSSVRKDSGKTTSSSSNEGSKRTSSTGIPQSPRATRSRANSASNVPSSPKSGHKGVSPKKEIATGKLGTLASAASSLRTPISECPKACQVATKSTSPARSRSFSACGKSHPTSSITTDQCNPSTASPNSQQPKSPTPLKIITSPSATANVQAHSPTTITTPAPSMSPSAQRPPSPSMLPRRLGTPTKSAFTSASGTTSIPSSPKIGGRLSATKVGTPIIETVNQATSSIATQPTVTIIEPDSAPSEGSTQASAGRSTSGKSMRSRSSSASSSHSASSSGSSAYVLARTTPQSSRAPSPAVHGSDHNSSVSKNGTSSNTTVSTVSGGNSTPTAIASPSRIALAAGSRSRTNSVSKSANNAGTIGSNIGSPKISVAQRRPSTSANVSTGGSATRTPVPNSTVVSKKPEVKPKPSGLGTSMSPPTPLSSSKLAKRSAAPPPALPPKPTGL
jgi:hypothetical protein